MWLQNFSVAEFLFLYLLMDMVTATTEGVKVSVETFYQEEYSGIAGGEFVFAYRITIENKGTSSVKLLRRHWHIFDSINDWKEVEGEGVVGEQPVIEPGGLHQYISGCSLRSTSGKMFGTYLMERQDNELLFEVAIPEFKLITPFLLN
jgi:ApaG protein